MTRPLLVTLSGAEHLTGAIAKHLNAECAEMMIRRFPDGETYLRYITPPKNRDVVLLANLHRPDDKLSELIFASRAATDHGAASIGLVAPYLPYMRQDKQFEPGEAVTAPYFADLLSSLVRWLVTMDPHLHRICALSDVYWCETEVTHAAPAIAEWVKSHVPNPLIIGPDAESQQWVSQVAKGADCNYITLEKIRHGDRDVDITLPDLTQRRGCTPVIVDDTISTAGTMMRVATLLSEAGMAAPICCAVHGVFSGNAFEALADVAGAKIVTCNTIKHVSNAIDISPALAIAARSQIANAH